MPTVTIDDAAFAEAKSLAEQRHQTVDEVVAAVFHDALRKMATEESQSSIPLLSVRDTTPVIGSVSQDGFVFETRDGVPVLPYTDRSHSVTLEMVQKMQDEMGL